MKRDNKRRLLFGVCAGMAKEFNAPPVAVRLLFILLTFLSVGLVVIGYLTLAVLMPGE